eukprot:m.656860 g.656860  ORF g.656860 m.656860 type:complete len:165 (+) comp22707_c1_seq9:2299-2793(+)
MWCWEVRSARSTDSLSPGIRPFLPCPAYKHALGMGAVDVACIVCVATGMLELKDTPVPLDAPLALRKHASAAEQRRRRYGETFHRTARVRDSLSAMPAGSATQNTGYYAPIASTYQTSSSDSIRNARDAARHYHRQERNQPLRNRNLLPPPPLDRHKELRVVTS